MALPPRVSSHFNVAILNSGLAFWKKQLHSESFRLKFQTHHLTCKWIYSPSHIEEGDYSLRHYCKNTFLVRAHRLSLSKKILCVVALPTDQPCRDRDCGKGLMIRASQCCSCSPCPLIHDVPVGFTKSTSAQHRRSVTVDPALALLFWKSFSFSLIIQLKSFSMMLINSKFLVSAITVIIAIKIFL